MREPAVGEPEGERGRTARRKPAHVSGDGFILVRVVADETEILSIAVSPDRRQRGLASRLLEQACHRATGQGAARIFLEVAAANLPARKLYEKYGFREVGQRKAYYEDGDDALVLSAVLPLAMGNPEKTL